MKSLKFILFYFLIFTSTITNAQKYDNTWLFGSAGTGSTFTDSFAITILDFQHPSLGLDTLERNIVLYFTNTSISDPFTGNLQFYTNGKKVYNKNHSIMANGDSINFGTSNWTGGNGYNAIYGAVALPFPNHPNQYYLLHQRIKSVPVFVNLPMDFMLTKIDMAANNGNGKVLSKNQSILHDSLANVLTATKHANGRDYWILQQNTRGHKFYLYLLDPTGINLKSTQIIGTSLMNSQGQGSGFFSPDGSKYAFFDAYNGIYIFDFDRCTGLLSNRVVIPYDYTASAASGFCNIMFSPNSQILYFSQYYHFSQYDLNATDIAASKDTVAVYDGFMQNNNARTTFLNMQIAPNGKIYMNTGGATKYLHVIENPDVLGVGCNVVQRGVLLRGYNNRSMPNFPNYRLGALSGSPCDTLNVATEGITENENIRVFPNPASNEIVLEYKDFQNKQITITDALGRVQKTAPLPSEITNISTQNLPNGIYYVSIYESNVLLGSSKFVVQHE